MAIKYKEKKNKIKISCSMSVVQVSFGDIRIKKKN